MNKNVLVLKKKDKVFSNLLREIGDCPNELYCLGNVNLLNSKKIVAIVGSRNMTNYGRKMVDKIVPKLVEGGWIIVSGMALGVDGYVQRLCLSLGGSTIAVLASGVDVPSPKSNSDLYDQIIARNSLVVSEMELGSLPKKESFLPTYRIIAGLSMGVVVVEASRRSGTLATASRAGDYGRELMVVPGRVGDINSGGVNWLLNNGAGLVESGQDVIDVLGV